MSIDPLAEKYNWMTDYQFSSNQVVFGREIEGMENDCDFNDRKDYMDGVEPRWRGYIPQRIARNCIPCL